jgi:1-acyl-sn-glycerol-3-phosphate acyltransferase
MKSVQHFQNTVKVFTETYSYIKKTKNNFDNINDLKSDWARNILSRLNVEVQILGHPEAHDSMLFVGNHISYLDIPLIMSAATKISFVAKQELNSWPVFGSAARIIDTVFVKRSDKFSRLHAKKSVATALELGKRIVVFPSGTTCMHEHKIWKKGSFEIANELNIWIQPFRISYSPLREVAYIDNDFFPLHLYELCKHKKITAILEFHKPVKINNPIIDCAYWQDWSRG